MAASATESAVAQSHPLPPVAESVPTQQVLDPVVLAEETTASRPAPLEQESPAAKLDSVVLSEDQTPARSALETPRLETVVAGTRSESAATGIAENAPSREEEQSVLRMVPPRDKGQPARQHAWRRPRTETAFALYWRDVATSFVRDWRALFASFAPMVSAFAGNVPQRADSLRRKVLTPLRAWLRTPINSTRPRDADSDSPASRVKKS